MRRDRNTFFQESQMFNTTNMPNNMMYPNMNMQQPNMNMQQPISQGASSNSYYYGPDINPNNTLENKILKMERQIHQLESRVSKLETFSSNTTIDDNTTTNSNMYMI